MHPLPKLIRFLLYHGANGMVFGAAVLLAVSYLDIAGIGSMLARDGTGIATLIFYFQIALTSGAVSMGIAVMCLGTSDKD